jgi:hypothetical protein
MHCRNSFTHSIDTSTKKKKVNTVERLFSTSSMCAATGNKMCVLIKRSPCDARCGARLAIAIALLRRIIYFSARFVDAAAYLSGFLGVDELYFWVSGFVFRHNGMCEAINKIVI